MKRLSLTLLLFVLVSSAYADPFSDALDASPPHLPGAGLQGDEDEVQITFFLTDGTPQPMENMHIAIMDSYQGVSKTTLQYVKSDRFILTLSPGEHFLSLKGDALATPGGDYYYGGEVVITEEANVTLQVLPVGSVRGTVVIKGELAPEATVKYECGKQYGVLEEEETDPYGSFSNDYLPVGMCRIYARQSGHIGYIDDVEVKTGEVTVVEIELNRDSAGESPVYWILGVIIIVLLIIGLFSYLKKRPQKLKKEQRKENTRTHDLLKTLNAKEQQVVGLLMKEGELYQNKITHNTGIPKTSLVRILMGLEQKKMIAIAKIGKTKKVKLTKWFLNKEK